jgi:hypothetical protein
MPAAPVFRAVERFLDLAYSEHRHAVKNAPAGFFLAAAGVGQTSRAGRGCKKASLVRLFVCLLVCLLL